MKRAVVSVAVVLASLFAALPAHAAYNGGIQHLHFTAGPYTVTPGANLILLDYNKVKKPTEDGYMIRMQPNLRYALPDGRCCGRIPYVSVIHLHHGVWLSNGAAGAGEANTYGSFYPFMATGEEKTVTEFPKGYGYPVAAHDQWVLNYMIHNLTSRPARVYVTYSIDFIPAISPLAAHITAVHPIWMDVESHHLYPVFNVRQYSGRDGKFTFPDMAKNPYGSGPPLNEFTVGHAGTLIGTAGHVHPGGLYTDLDLIRAGAQVSHGAIPGPLPHSVRLFRSYAHYFDRRGPISWNMAMEATNRDWRVAVKPGDVMRVSATYDTTRASWYETMGIMVVWEAWNDSTGVDPFNHALDQRGHLTHGYLPENNDNGGSYSLHVHLNKFPTCFRRQVYIAGFHYLPGDFTATGPERCTPTVHHGHSLAFVNEDASPQAVFDILSPNVAYLHSIFHTVTACRNPCGLNTGISYPLANGAGGFDSGQLGIGPPALGHLSWNTPTNLPPGTYTFYCRIHPWMRGVFHVIG